MGEMTASLNLEFKINGKTANYYWRGTRLSGSGWTHLTANSQAHTLIADTTLIAVAQVIAGRIIIFVTDVGSSSEAQILSEFRSGNSQLIQHMGGETTDQILTITELKF